MSRLPQPFWAVFLAGMGAVLAIISLFHQTDATVRHDVLTIASGLVTGALGAFAGHNASKTDVATGNAPVTINQGDAK